jgi:PAS domain S-box-containing protein
MTVGFTGGRAFKELNLNPEDFVGMTIEEVFKENATKVKSFYERTFKGEETNFELYIDKQYQLYRTLPIYNEAGEIDRILSVVENITEMKNNLKEIQGQNEKFTATLDAVEETIYISDMNSYDMIFLNKKGQEIFGDYKGKKCYEVLQSGQTSPCSFCTNNKLTDADGNPDKPYIWEFQNTKTGQWFGLTDKAVEWVDGRIVRIEVAVDITQRKKAEQALKERSEQSELVLESARIGWWDWDIPSGKEVYNEILPELLGYHLNEIEPHITWWENRIHPDDYPEVSKDLQEHFEGKTEYYENEHRLLTKEGEWMWFFDFGKVIERDESGNAVRMIGTLRIIDDVKKKEQQLIDTGNKLKASNQRFDMAMEASSDGIFDWNLNTNEIYYTPRWKSMLGYKDEELPNDFSIWETLTHPDDVKKSWSMLNELLEGKREKFEIEFKMKHKDGSWVDILSRANKFLDKNGKPYRVVGTHTDISVRKEHEKKIKESEERFRKLINNMPAGIAIYKAVNNGKDFEFVDVNIEAEFITNSTKDELIGKTLLEKFPNMDKSPLLESLRKVHKNGEHLHIPPFYYEDKRRHGWRENKIYKLHSGEIVAIFSDVTSLMEAELKLKQTNDILSATNKDLVIAKEKAEESNNLKSAFLQNLSHEIRTPLNAISGFAGMLGKPDLTDNKRDSFVKIIQNSSTRLLEIVSDILTISSLETKQEKVNMTEFNVNEILIELLTIFKQQASGGNIALYSRQSLDNTRAIISSDRVKIYRIINNLVSNSLKFTHDGHIEFGYELKGDFLEFYVKDTGMGIAPENIEVIFERFNQASGAIHAEYGGTGLGLAISKGFVELLGGDIRVTSEQGVGSEFYFTIPYNPVNKALPPEAQSKSSTEESNSNPRIIIAEDEEYNFLLLEEMLIDKGFEIIHALNGVEVIDTCRSDSNVAIILMDIKMPVMNGYEAAKIIKKEYPRIPIIAQSAYGLEEEIKYYSQVFDSYIPKPIGEKELMEKINMYLD